MLETQQEYQQQKTIAAAQINELDQINQLYLSQGRMWFYFGIGATAITFVVFLCGLIVWLTGIVEKGWIASVASTAPGILSALFFNQSKEANTRLENMRIELEKIREEVRKKQEQEQQEGRKRQEQQQEEEQKRREQEQQEEQKKQEQEQYEHSRILMLEAFYQLALKTDDEQKKEVYFHGIFRRAEYNKWRIEAYFNLVSRIQDESAKRGMFREMFPDLLNE